jgi:M6 family metalloprotease-like protein
LRHKRRIGLLWLLLGLIISAPIVAGQNGKVLPPLSVEKRAIDKNDPKIAQHGFISQPSRRNILNLERERPGGLPKLSAAAAEAVDTIRILALRVDFVYEVTDDPSTTGRGSFDLRDTLRYFAEMGHSIDPSPHLRNYFSKHLQALDNYYDAVSEGKLVLQWEVYPQVDDSCYHLPHAMGYYGSVNPYIGLVNFLNDAIVLADTSDAAIHFADYNSIIVFHAGSDRQNDIGFPPTTSDLYTGNVVFGDDSQIYVDKTASESTLVADAVVMPETACQDNRGTALNAVMAHEFGHQLGLVDLYRTDNFFTQVGDFSLMDDNGFGTGIDFGFVVGRIFGTMPVYPDAWSRSFLGFVEPVIFRRGTDIPVVAAEMAKDGIKVAKIPISEFEYFLIENRQIEVDGKPNALLADSATSVIMGPIDSETRIFSHEYDILLPGSGILIWHVDERVAMMDFNGDGYNNFESNQLQWNPNQLFVKLMEADGLVNFGGIYYSGYGTQEDMYYAGNNSSLTPNSNPSSDGNNGVISHIYVTDISSSDTTMTFNVDVDKFAAGFPQRIGYPAFGLPSIAADLDHDDTTEIITCSNRNICIMKENGDDFTPLGSVYYDTTYSMSGQNQYPVPLFARTNYTITAGPVVGDFGKGPDSNYVAVGASYYVYLFSSKDVTPIDGQGDLRWTLGAFTYPIVSIMTIDDKLYYAEDNNQELPRIRINCFKDGHYYPRSPMIEESNLYGMTDMGKGIALLAGDTANVKLYLVMPSDTARPLNDTISFDLEGYYYYGPITVDLNRDSLPEIVMATPDGTIKAVTVDTTVNPPTFQLYREISLGDTITANPIAADIDDDGYADIIAGGINKIFGFDKNFIALTSFPITIDRGFPYDYVISSPSAADINHDGREDIVVYSSNGNCYAFGPELLYGFPLSAGGIGSGSPLVFPIGANSGGLGFAGVDGWYYSYDIAYDSSKADWPMGGADAYGRYALDNGKLGSIAARANRLPKEQFYCYPNPSLDGRTTIRYFLGDDARVTMAIYDLSGKKVEEFAMNGSQGTIERNWDGSALATGVYRCLLKADFGGVTETAFTDIAIIK